MPERQELGHRLKRAGAREDAAATEGAQAGGRAGNNDAGSQALRGKEDPAFGWRECECRRGVVAVLWAWITINKYTLNSGMGLFE